MSVFSAYPGLFYPGTTWPGFIDPAQVDVPTPRPRTFAARLVAYEADGDRIGPMPEHLSFEAVVRYNDVGTLRLSYSAHAAQGTVVTRPLIQGTEIALEVWTGSAWWEPVGGRYIVTEREFDTQDDGQAVVNLSAQSMGWMLAKVRSLNTTVLLPEDHSQAGKRPFYAATPGEVVGTVLAEYEEREGSRAWWRDFDESVDSMSRPWERTGTFFFEHLQSLDVIVESLAAAGLCDWTTIGRDLALYNPDTELGVDSSSVIVLHEGSHVVSAPSRESIADLISRIGFEGGQAEDGNGNRQPPLRLLEDDEAAPAPWGAWEGAYSNSSITDEGTALSYLQAELARSGRVRGQYIRELTEALPEGSYLPLYDYGPGHWITAPAANGLEKLRVQEVQVRDDGEGTTVALVLNDVFLDAELRRAKRAIGIPAGSASGGSDVRPVPEGQDKRQPAAPSSLAVSTSTYIDSDGAARGIIHAQWSAVTTATAGDGGGPLEVSAYEVWHRPNVLGAPWSRATATAHPDTDADLSPYDVGSEWQIKVRARGRYATTPGDWSETKTIEVADDTAPPPVPSAPTWTEQLGIPIPVWDGLDADGLAMPRDFDRVQCYVGTSAADPGNLTDAQCHDVRHSAGPFAPVTEYPANTVVYARFRAFDRSGNASGWTAPVQATVEDILAPIQDDIDDLVNNVVPGLEGAITTASGRFTASTSAPTPGDGAGKPVGAFWSQYDGQRLVGTWVWDGDSWEEREPQQVHIDTGTFGDLDGARLKAYSVLAQAIAVGDFSNPVDNPMTYPDLGGWVAEEGQEAGLTYNPEASHPAGGTHSLRFAAGAAVNEYGLAGRLAKNTREFKVHEGEKYRVTFRRRQSGGGTSVTVGLRVRKTDGGYQNVTVTSTTSASGLVQHTGEVTIPANGIMARPFVSVYRTAGSTDVTDIEIRNMVGGVLISDGAVSAPKIAANQIQAQHLEAVLALVSRIVSGNPTGTRAEMDPDGFKVYRAPDDDSGSEAYLLTSLGSASVNDVFTVLNPSGAEVASITSDGSISGYKGSFSESLSINGTDLVGTLTSEPVDVTLDTEVGYLDWHSRGLKGRYGPSGEFPAQGTSQRGSMDFEFIGIAGRAYEITVQGLARNSASNGHTVIQLRKTQVDLDTGNDPPDPTSTSSTIGEATRVKGDTNVYNGFSHHVLYTPTRSERARFLLCYGAVTAGTSQITRVEITVKDVGYRYAYSTDWQTNSSGADGGGSPPATKPKKRYTSRWYATSITNYQGTVSSPPSGGSHRMGQGRVANMGTARRSFALFSSSTAVSGETGKTLAQAIPSSGATIVDVKVRLSNMRSVKSAVNAVLGRSTSQGGGVTPTNLMTSPPIPRSGTVTFKVPGLKNVSVLRGTLYLTVGPGSSSANESYAEFAGTGDGNSKRIMLEVTYEK